MKSDLLFCIDGNRGVNTGTMSDQKKQTNKIEQKTSLKSK